MSRVMRKSVFGCSIRSNMQQAVQSQNMVWNFRFREKMDCTIEGTNQLRSTLSSVGIVPDLIARLRVQISLGAGWCVLQQDASSSLLSTGSTRKTPHAWLNFFIFFEKLLTGMYMYTNKKKQKTDQLRNYCTADLRLCFPICKNHVFSFMAQIMDIKTDIIYTQGLDAQADLIIFEPLIEKAGFSRVKNEKRYTYNSACTQCKQSEQNMAVSIK